MVHSVKSSMSIPQFRPEKRSWQCYGLEEETKTRRESGHAWQRWNHSSNLPPYDMFSQHVCAIRVAFHTGCQEFARGHTCVRLGRWECYCGGINSNTHLSSIIQNRLNYDYNV